LRAKKLNYRYDIPVDVRTINYPWWRGTKPIASQMQEILQWRENSHSGYYRFFRFALLEINITLD
jgi:hypothetical protein